jgi:hypothetical protein
MGAESPVQSRRGYPRKVEIARVVEAAKACGLDVAGIEVSRDGVIRAVEARAIPMPKDEFERWEDRL